MQTNKLNQCFCQQEHCQLLFPLIFQAHDEICPKYPMMCEGCAKKKIPREKVRHIFPSEFSFSMWTGMKCNGMLFAPVASVILVLQYVDHIKFCSKFKAPCRFHVVGCDTSVSRCFCLKFPPHHSCIRDAFFPIWTE